LYCNLSIEKYLDGCVWILPLGVNQAPYRGTFSQPQQKNTFHSVSSTTHSVYTFQALITEIPLLSASARAHSVRNSKGCIQYMQTRIGHAGALDAALLVPNTLHPPWRSHPLIIYPQSPASSSLCSPCSGSQAALLRISYGRDLFPPGLTSQYARTLDFFP